MNLTDAEIAYLKRFEFETWYRLDGEPVSIFAECRAMAPHLKRASYLGDMADLATPSIQYQVLRDVQFEPDYTKLIDKYPKVPFPWESLEALHRRVLELEPLKQPKDRGPDLDPLTTAQEVLAWLHEQRPDWHIEYEPDDHHRDPLYHTARIHGFSSDPDQPVLKVLVDGSDKLWVGDEVRSLWSWREVLEERLKAEERHVRSDRARFDRVLARVRRRAGERRRPAADVTAGWIGMAGPAPLLKAHPPRPPWPVAGPARRR